jgi:hypothetical protein
MTLHDYQLAALVAAARWVVEGARGERAHAAVYHRLTTHSRSSRPSWRKRTRKARSALEREVVAGWDDFRSDRGMEHRHRIVTATARN